MTRLSPADLLVWAAGRDDVMARFWARVARPEWTGCWIWTGALSDQGHGRFWIGEGRVVIADRLAWMAAHHGQEVPEVVTHDCDNPCCQNPDHLRAGDRSTNGLEYWARRGVPGSPLNDRRGARKRAEALREAVLTGRPVSEVLAEGLSDVDRDQEPLW